MPKAKQPPLPDTPTHVQVFAAPAKISRQAVAIKAQREKYITEVIAKGVPPTISRLVCNRYSSPSKISKVIGAWTGRCAKLNIPLTDAGTKLDTSVLLMADGTFVSRLAKRFQGTFTDAQLLGLCTLVYNKHHASTTKPNLGGLHQDHISQHNSVRLGGAAIEQPRPSQWQNTLGLR